MQTSVAENAIGDRPRPHRTRWQTSERLVAVSAAVLLGIRTSVGPSVSVSLLVVVLAVPIWLPVLTRTTGGRVLCLLGVLAFANGAVLTASAAGTHVIDKQLLESTNILMFTCLGGVGVLVWAASVLTVRATALSFGLGMLFDGLLDYRTVPTDNPLKYIFGIPLTVVILALATYSTKLVWQAVAVAALAALFAVSDTRSYFATALLVLGLVVWQMRPGMLGRRSSAVWTAATMAAMGAGVYYLGTTLLVDGALGAQAQLRSVQQIDSAGSLILGGRPELAATWALLRDRPFGFGPGVLASMDEINVAKAGMLAINYDPNNGYVDDFMFGDGIEVHSFAGDIWAHFGFLGICLSLFILIISVRGMAILIARRLASGLILFVAVFALWSLLFSPFYSTTPNITLLLALLLCSVPSVDRVTGERRIRTGR